MPWKLFGVHCVHDKQCRRHLVSAALSAVQDWNGLNILPYSDRMDLRQDKGWGR